VPPDLSAIVLCYRAGDDLRHVIEPLYGDLEALGVPFEMVLVANYWAQDDDPTPGIVEEFARDHEAARPIIGPKGGGMGWDMRSGLDAARGEYMIVIDGDEQNPVEDVLAMYRQMKRRELDVMKGRRIARFDGYYRQFVSFAYNLIFLAMFGTRGLWDINGKPKGLTRSSYERMDLTSDGWFIDAEMVLEALRLGLRLDELPVVFRHNIDRSSMVGAHAVGEFARNMVKYRLGRRG
jgi:glycosyltransferase involved in cell wall biosynthesis